MTQFKETMDTRRTELAEIRQYRSRFNFFNTASCVELSSAVWSLADLSWDVWGQSKNRRPHGGFEPETCGMSV